MKRKHSSISYIVVTALLVAAALLALLAFTRGNFFHKNVSAEAVPASSENSSLNISERSGSLPEKSVSFAELFSSGNDTGSSSVSTEESSSEAITESTSEPADEAAPSAEPEETETQAAPTEDPTPTPTPEPTKEPADPAAGYLADLETIPAATLVDTSLLDPENIGQYFRSFEISDDLFARIYGDNRSYKTYCTVPREHLRYIKVLYNDFEGNTRVGEIMVNYLVADDILYIFEELYKMGYQFELIVLVDDFEADDDISILHNNTSAFNFRNITGGNTPSNHAYGTAIDINPYNNPYVLYDGDGNPVLFDAGANQYLDREAEDAYERHMINYNDPCYQLFTGLGWTWGGDWANPTDYQHFEKVIYP